MHEVWMLIGFLAVNLVGVGFFFGSICQQIKDLDERVKSISNDLTEMQSALTDIKAKTMNINSRLISLERGRNNAGEDEE